MTFLPKHRRLRAREVPCTREQIDCGMIVAFWHGLTGSSSQVNYARGLNSKFSKEVYCDFEIYKAPNSMSEDGRYQTPTMSGTTNPNFNFSQQVTWQSVDADVVQQLTTGSTYFHLWGLQDDKSGDSGPVKRKMLSVAEAEALGSDLKRAQDDLKKFENVLYKINDACCGAASAKEASEDFLLQIADSMAESGLDVTRLTELAGTVGPLGGDGGGGGGGGGANDSEVASLKAKIVELEAKGAAVSAAPTATPDAEHERMLAEKLDEIKKKEEELVKMTAMKIELENKVKEGEAKEAELKAKLDKAMDPSNPHEAMLMEEKNKLEIELKMVKEDREKREGEKKDIQGQLDKVRMELMEAKTKANAGCSSACAIM